MTTARSCAGWAYAWSRQTAIASTSSSDGNVGQVERDDHALRAHALTHPDAPLERHERLGVRGAEAIEMGAVLTPQVQEMLEALGRDERRACPAPLQQRVRGHGRTVGEAVEAASAAPTARAAASTDSSCAAAVGTFAVRISAPSTRTASVKVPPTSIPSTRMAPDSTPVPASSRSYG